MPQRILILGCGYITGSLIHFLTRLCPNQKYHIVVGSIIPKELEELQSQFESVETFLVDVEKEEDYSLLKEQISRAQLVVSLVPNNSHLKVGKACIEKKVNMLHASYNTKELCGLHSDAVKAGVLILGEMGVDPGLDHFLAMKVIHEVQEGKGKISKLSSYSGGLPAPEYINNPLRYKFSWSPRTSLANLLNGAKYLQNKIVVEIPSGGKILEVTRKVQFMPEFQLEAYPNRDSLSYLDKYGISSSVKSIFRGTLRHQGFSEGAKTLIKFGYLSKDPLEILDPTRDHSPLSWREFTAYLLRGRREDIRTDDLRNSIKAADFKVLQGLGLVSEALLDKLYTPLDTLSKHLERTLKFKKGEQDLVILHHEIEAKFPPTLNTPGGSMLGHKEFREVDFVLYGDPCGYSALAKTVSFILGISAQMILNKEIKRTGVVLPLTKDIYSPVLERLAEHGLFAIERISSK